MGSQENGRPLDPTSRRTYVGERVHIDEVIGDNGPVSLPDLADVADTVQPAKGSILVGDGSVFQEFPAGADNEVLIYDSAEPFGVRTGAASGGSATAPVEFGADSVGSSTTTRYLYPGHSDALAETALYEWVIPVAGTLRRLYVLHNTPAGNGNIITYTVMVNGVASSLAVGLASTSGLGSNLVISVAVSAGDRIAIRVTKASAVGASPSNVLATFEVGP